MNLRSEDSDSSVSANEMADQSLKHGTGLANHRGVSMKSGKWRARIRHPISKVRIWIGTYDSLKEATDAYNRMKLEFDDEMKKDEPDLEKIISARNCTGFVKHQGVSQKLGKWRARIRHPITKDRIWLGTYNSRKEATDAYDKMKLEIDDEMKKDEPDLEKITSARNCIRKPRGSVYRVEKGKGRWRWRAEIRTKKFRKYLGLYDTAEEARAAVDRRINSLDLMADPQMNKRESKDQVEFVDKQPNVCVEEDTEAQRETDMNLKGIQMENEGFNVGVIDANGELIGEFSRLDDELWLCRSLVDDDHPYII